MVLLPMIKVPDEARLKGIFATVMPGYLVQGKDPSKEKPEG